MLYQEERSLPAVLSRLRQMGITHICLNRNEFALWEADSKSTFHDAAVLFARFRQDFLTSVYQDEQNEVLSLSLTRFPD